jgi:hypothetical protein
MRTVNLDWQWVLCIFQSLVISRIVIQGDCHFLIGSLSWAGWVDKGALAPSPWD